MKVGADRRREGERKRGKLIELSSFDEIALYIQRSKVLSLNIE